MTSCLLPGIFLQVSSGRQQSEKRVNADRKKKQLAQDQDEWKKRKEEKKKFLIEVTSCHALRG